MWDRTINILDWLVIGAVLLLAGLTLLASSNPIPGTDVYLFGAIVWSLVAMGWSVSVLATVRERAAVVAAVLLLIGAAVSFPYFWIVPVLFFIGGTIAFAVLVLAGLGLLAVVVVASRVKRVAWLIAPVVVVAMFAVMYTGLPRLTRMTLAEPALNEFAQTVDLTATLEYPMWFDEGLSVGSIPVYEAYVWHGGVHLVTGFVGLLGDDNAGIAYFPNGAPAADPPYEHLVGAWYRWFPY